MLQISVIIIYLLYQVLLVLVQIGQSSCSSVFFGQARRKQFPSQLDLVPENLVTLGFQ